MSTAQASRTIKFVAKGRSYSAMLVSRSGDLYQEYQTGANDLRPDWQTEQPEIQFIAAVSGLASTVPDFTKVEVYIGGDKIIDTETSSMDFTNNYYKPGNTDFANDVRLYPAADKNNNGATNDPGDTPWRVKFTSNQFVKTMYAGSTPAPFLLRVRGYLSASDTDYVEAALPVNVAKSSGTGHILTIGFANDSDLSISAKWPDKPSTGGTEPKGYSATMEARLIDRSNGSAVSDATFRWYNITSGGATEVTATSGDLHVVGGDKKQLYVSEPAVDSFALFRCDGYLPGSTSVVAAVDTQGIMDTSDPYDIEPNPEPVSETITEGTGGSVAYTPRVIVRAAGSNNTGITDTQHAYTYNFHCYDSAGTELTGASASGRGQGSPFSVTENMCDQAGGDVQLIIEAVAQ